VGTFWGKGGFFRCERPHFDAKNTGFFEIYGVSACARTRGVESVQIFWGQEERGSIFRDFVRRTAPKLCF